MADFSAVFNSIPPVTRVLLLGIAVVTGPCLLGLLSPFHAALLWTRVARFEIWRPVTAFFYGGAGFPLLFDFFLIYRNSSSLEKDTYFNDTAEYAWLHLMLALFIQVLSAPLGIPFLFRPLLHAQTYTWCRANPTMKVSIFGLLTIPTSLYPFALILLDLITGGTGKALSGLVGLLAGHLWWFISIYLPKHAIPRHRRSNPLSTPSRFKRLFPGRDGMSQASAIQSRVSATATGRQPSGPDSEAFQATRHRWGTGSRLGGEGL